LPGGVRLKPDPWCACAELRRCSGSQFMPAAVDALITVVERPQRRVRFSQAA
jgi:hypothetical protein